MNKNVAKNNKGARVLIWLVVFVLAMFAFGYALVPLYNVLCKVAGINGKIYGESKSNSTLIDKSRTIQVTFISHVHSDLSWKFYPMTKKIDVHPGQKVQLKFFAQNDTNQTMTVQAIPSVTPGQIASKLQKTECFCFEQQTLKPHQSIEMPLIFHLDTDIPKNIHDITLSYTLYKWTRPIRNKTKGRLTN